MLDQIMTNGRVDLYSMPHKRMREVLFQASMKLAAVDFSNEETLSTASTEVRKCIEELDQHAKNEESFLHPLYLERIADKKILAHLNKDHHHFEETLVNIKHLLSDLEGTPSTDLKERRVNLRKLYRAFDKFLGEYMLHLEEEEDQLQLIWDAYTNEELFHLFHCFLTSLGVPGQLESVKGFWNSLPDTEAKRLYAGLKANSSPAVFLQVEEALSTKKLQ